MGIQAVLTTLCVAAATMYLLRAASRAWLLSEGNCAGGCNCNGVRHEPTEPDLRVSLTLRESGDSSATKS